jgi:hypothetical protein
MSLLPLHVLKTHILIICFSVHLRSLRLTTYHLKPSNCFCAGFFPAHHEHGEVYVNRFAGFFPAQNETELAWLGGDLYRDVRRLLFSVAIRHSLREHAL